MIRARLTLAMVVVLVPACTRTEPAARCAQPIIGGSTDPTSAAVAVRSHSPVFDPRYQLCSGVVVSPHVVLTAAHCLDGAANRIYEVDVAEDIHAQSGDEYAVIEKVLHPSYSPDDPTAGADIGAVITEQALPVSPLPLNTRPLDPAFVGSSVRAIGYGKTDASQDDERLYGTRRQVEVDVTLSDDEFFEYGDAGAGICFADSGGPSLALLDGVETIVGIHAGVDSAACDGVGRDTRADRYAEFVTALIEQHDPGFLHGTAGCQAVGSQAQAIAGGTEAPLDSMVVAVTPACTGTLIAPNVVLTAHHCVAVFHASEICAESTYDPPLAPLRFSVSTAATIEVGQKGPHAVRAIIPLPDPAEPQRLCGDDLALVVLEAPIPATEAAPAVPRLDELVAGEPFSAIGFGSAGEADPDPELKTRRRRDGLHVACVGLGCADDPNGVQSREWVGEDEGCKGDSGGPAFDAAGRLIGVHNRGANVTGGAPMQCSGTSIYNQLAPHAAWLKAEVTRASTEAGLEPPSWAMDRAIDPPVTPPVESGCSIAAGPARAPVALLLLVAALLRPRARRRRTS